MMYWVSQLRCCKLLEEVGYTQTTRNYTEMLGRKHLSDVVESIE